jgi:hypothetical protein
MHINGPEQGKLSKAILSAFPNPMKLGPAIKSQLDDDVNNYVVNWGTYPDTVNEMLTAYNARYKIGPLVSALLNENPTNEKLLEFAWRHQIIKRPGGAMGQSGPDDGSLERMLEPGRGFTDVGEMLRRLGQVTNSVCQISYPVPNGIEYGTGFLIGNSTVLTNWHVVEHVTPANRRDVKLLFDYRTGPDGSALSQGVVYRLEDRDDWLLDGSPYDTEADNAVRPIDEERQLNRNPEKLDYAVLRIAGEPGNKPIGSRESMSSVLRGCLPLSEAVEIPADLSSSAWCFEHPCENGQSLPLQCDHDKPGFLGVNPNRTRVWYTINTRGGSSGSPILTGKLQLCALHHAGGKDWPAPGRLLYNRGIPIISIRELLRKRGKLDEIN